MYSQEGNSKNKRKADPHDFTKDPDLESYDGWASGVVVTSNDVSYFTQHRDKNSGFDTASDSSDEDLPDKKKEDDDLTTEQIKKQISQYKLKETPFQKEPGMNLLSMEVCMEDDAESGSGISDDKDVGPSKATRKGKKLRERSDRARKMYKFNEKNNFFLSPRIYPVVPRFELPVGINQIADQARNLMLQDENMYFEGFETPSSSNQVEIKKN